MKATYKFVIAALAATLALASCTKETAEPGIADSATKGVRTIAVSFGNSTKSSLWDGPTPLTPTFKIDDEICVAQADGEAEPQTCKVKLGEGGILVIETDLEGILDAVYPATAAAISEDGKRITGVNVPTLQSGTFAEANICQATIPAGSSNAEFENKVSILKFYVDASIEVLGLRITAAEEFELVVQSDINVKSASSSIPPLWQGTDDPSKRISYVAVSPKVYENFTVSSYTTTQDAYEDMAVVKEFGDVTFAEGTIYNVFIPYYIKVFVGTDENGDVFQKWGYCNVGAFLPEEPGYYFSWGNTQGYVRNKNEWMTPDGANALKGGFCEEAYANTNGAKIEGRSLKADATEDAACAAWKGKWRIPTEAEFIGLKSATKTWESDYFSSGQEGLLIQGFDNRQLFLPGVGLGRWNELCPEDYGNGSYWRSEFGENPDEPQTIGSRGSLLFMALGETIYFETVLAGKFFGLPIRPIYGDSAPEGVGLTMPSFGEGEML